MAQITETAAAKELSSDDVLFILKISQTEMLTAITNCQITHFATAGRNI
ncbi:MAG: hypothetical protein II931_07140 [Clostridia bacterium]|nr:hypothetical protein [Clostridia bacterium]